MNRYAAVVLIAGCVAAAFLAGAYAQNADVPSGPVAPRGWQHLALEHAGDIVTSDAQLAGKINQLGVDGWELVSVNGSVKDGTTTKTVFYFKRPRR